MDRVHVVACVSEDSHVNIDSVWLDFNLACNRWDELEEPEWVITSIPVNKGQYTLDQEVEAVEE